MTTVPPTHHVLTPCCVCIGAHGLHFARAPARCHPVPRHAVRTPAPLSSTQAAPSGGTTRPRWLSCGTVPPLYFPCVMVVTVHQSPLVVAPLLLLACCCCLLVVVAAAAACCRLPSCGSTACVASVVTGWPLDAAAGKVKQLRRQWRKIRPASACPRPASTATRQTWRQGPACLR